MNLQQVPAGREMSMSRVFATSVNLGRALFATGVA